MSVKLLRNNACIIAVFTLSSFISSNEGSFLPQHYHKAAGIRHVSTPRSYGYDETTEIHNSGWRRVKTGQDGWKKKFYVELAAAQTKIQRLSVEYKGVMDERTQLAEENKQLEEMYKNAQRELSEERSRNSEVKTQMDTVRKDLVACKAQLPILQLEKESLQLKMKNEVTRNEILEQDKNALVEAAVYETIKSQTVACESRLRTLTENHNAKVAASELESKRLENEYLKASNSGMKCTAERDSLVKEKLELSKKYSDELEKCKTLRQEAISRNDGSKDNCNKSSEQNIKQYERMGGDADSKPVKCEVALSVLQEEKKNLQSKIDEEMAKNRIMDQDKTALVKKVASHQDPIRSEIENNDEKKLRVPTTKPMDCQERLHVAQLASQAQLETKQRIIDDHYLDTDLLGEIHRKKERLNEMKLAEALEKAAPLETRLNSKNPEENKLGMQSELLVHTQCLQLIQAITDWKAQNLASLQRAGGQQNFLSSNVTVYHE